jgi:hypothetical protein
VEEANLPQMIAFRATRAYNAESGDVTYTGVGFQPDIVMCVAGNTTSASTGIWENGGYEDCVYDDSSRATAHSVLFLVLSGLNAYNQSAAIVSVTSDGFTITWTRATGSGTGTGQLYLHFLCIKK